MSRFRDITVLITAAGNVFMPGTSACLREVRERRIRLIGADMNDDPTILNMFDAYYPVPRGDDPNYVNALLDICKKEAVDVLLPIMSVELNALADNIRRFEEIGVKVGVSDVQALTIANDKLRLFDYLKEHGIPCAEYVAIKSLKELDETVVKFGYPDKKVCIKVTDGSGSRGFRILDASRSRYEMYLHEKPSSCYIRLSEMREILAEADIFPTLMIMEYLPGDEYTVDLLADHGKVLVNCCRKSLSMQNSIMLNGKVVDNKQVLDLCRKVTESLKLDGNIGFDILEREDGTPFIVECNPRITAGVPFFYHAGVNLPYLNVKRLLGEELPNCTQVKDCVVVRRWQEMSRK